MAGAQSIEVIITNIVEETADENGSSDLATIGSLLKERMVKLPKKKLSTFMISLGYAYSGQEADKRARVRKKEYMSVDVECAATGKGHNDRAPCRIAAIDGAGQQLLDVIVRVPGMYDPLTPITGLDASTIDKGVELAEAVGSLKQQFLLGPHVVLVGQAIEKDIAWLGLKSGVDFCDFVDLAEKFKSWNSKREMWNKYSLRKEAYCLLGIEMDAGAPHDPTKDAKISMALFNKYVLPGTHKKAAKRLKDMSLNRQFPESLDANLWEINAVCCSAFDPRRCSCGQPTLRDQPTLRR